MSDIAIWKRMSTIGAWGCGITAIIHTFFGKYLSDIKWVLVTVEALVLFVYLLSDLLKFIIKRNSKK